VVRRYLVGYDISDDKRLRLVHRCARRFGYPLQYSLFICDLGRIDLAKMKWELGELILHTVDRVVFIDLGDPRHERQFDFLGVRPRLPTSGPTII
jgi:CRISPR-associated protein Cas2